MFNTLDLAAVSNNNSQNNCLTGITAQDCRAFVIAYGRGKRRALWNRLRGEDSNLFDLADVEGTRSRPMTGEGICSVLIASIIGSEGRVEDFDRAFNPRTRHNRDRWIGIAAARRQGKIFPPVDLIQVGDHYYVRDGHHRISVAAAAGQESIEARIVCVIT